MPENRQIQNSNTTRRNVRVPESVTTTDATPTVMYSIPLGVQRASFVQAQLIAIKSDFSAAQAIFLQSAFRRMTGGNVIKATPTNNSGFQASNGDFTGIAPKIDLVANTSTQTIDLVVTGKAATTIKWQVVLLSVQNLA